MKLEDLYCKNRSGKVALKLPAGSLVLPLQPIKDMAKDFVAAVTNTGHMLIFAIAELPQLPRGKGNKMLSIPTAKVTKREEYVADIAILQPDSKLALASGKRSFSLKPADLEHYKGERGRRGHKLPRGFQKVDRLVVS